MLTNPLKTAKNHGSAKDGTMHWWHQRLSAIALLFLVSWVVVSILTLAPVTHESLAVFLRAPHNALLTILLLCTMLYHGVLGIQVVVEDYVHCECMKITLLIATKLVSLLAAAATIFSVINVYFVG